MAASPAASIPLPGSKAGGIGAGTIYKWGADDIPDPIYDKKGRIHTGQTHTY